MEGLILEGNDPDVTVVTVADTIVEAVEQTGDVLDGIPDVTVVTVVDTIVEAVEQTGNVVGGIEDMFVRFYEKKTQNI